MIVVNKKSMLPLRFKLKLASLDVVFFVGAFALTLFLSFNVMQVSVAFANDCGQASGTCINGAIPSKLVCSDSGICVWTCSGQGISSCNSIPSVCGNGRIETGEQCDGTRLNYNTCKTLGFESGVLSCASNCSFNTTKCLGKNEPPKEEIPEVLTPANSLCGTSASRCVKAGFVVKPGTTSYLSCTDLGIGTGYVTCDTATCNYNLAGCGFDSNDNQKVEFPEDFLKSKTDDAPRLLDGFDGREGGIWISSVQKVIKNFCPTCVTPKFPAVLNGKKLSFDKNDKQLCNPSNATPKWSTMFDGKEVTKLNISRIKGGKDDNVCTACWRCEDPYGNSNGPCCTKVVSDTYCGSKCGDCVNGTLVGPSNEPYTGVCIYTCKPTCGQELVQCCQKVRDPATGAGTVRIYDRCIAMGNYPYGPKNQEGMSFTIDTSNLK